MSHNRIGMQPHDLNAAVSFYTTLSDGKDITEKQGAYMLKLLTKYRNTCAPYYDYRDLLENPVWKKPFRVVDNRKLIWIEKDEEATLWICLKFPFGFKETFDEEIAKSDEYMNSKTYWESEKKYRKLYFYDFNLINLVEFCKKHNFEIMDSVLDAMSQVEEVWNNQDDYIKTSVIENGELKLINAVDEAQDYFDKNKTLSINSNLILAKSLGHLYNGKIQTPYQKIAASKTNTFHCNNMQKFLKICYDTEGKVVILLDKTDQSVDWVKSLAWNIQTGGYDNKDFRVCFRMSNKIDPTFNKWVSDNGFGGKIDTAKFLIFREKPAKWLFKDEKDVIIVASNDLLPGLNSQAKHMLQSHTCVIYINEFKPVKQYGETIVEL